MRKKNKSFGFGKLNFIVWVSVLFFFFLIEKIEILEVAYSWSLKVQTHF